MVPVDSSDARMPFPAATSAFATSSMAEEVRAVARVGAVVRARERPRWMPRIFCNIRKMWLKLGEPEGTGPRGGAGGRWRAPASSDAARPG